MHGQCDKRASFIMTDAVDDGLCQECCWKVEYCNLLPKIMPLIAILSLHQRIGWAILAHLHPALPAPRYIGNFAESDPRPLSPTLHSHFCVTLSTSARGQGSLHSEMRRSRGGVRVADSCPPRIPCTPVPSRSRIGQVSRGCPS